MALCVFGTYRVLSKGRGYLSESTYKTMRMLINALTLETIAMCLIILGPIIIATLYEKFDTSLTAAAVKKVCYIFPAMSMPISDVIKLICVKNYR